MQLCLKSSQISGKISVKDFIFSTVVYSCTIFSTSLLKNVTYPSKNLKKRDCLDFGAIS